MMTDEAGVLTPIASVVVAAMTLRPEPGRRNSSSMTRRSSRLEVRIMEGDATRRARSTKVGLACEGSPAGSCIKRLGSRRQAESIAKITGASARLALLFRGRR